MMETNLEEGNLLFTDEYKKALEKASYEIVGNHSAVEICGWTKKGMNNESSGCYKQKFYGIRSHQCTQMTPAAVACDQNSVTPVYTNDASSSSLRSKMRLLLARK